MLTNVIVGVCGIPQIKTTKNGVQYYCTNTVYTDYDCFLNKRTKIWVTLMDYEIGRKRFYDTIKTGDKIEVSGDIGFSKIERKEKENGSVEFNVLMKVGIIKFSEILSYKSKQKDTNADKIKVTIEKNKEEKVKKEDIKLLENNTDLPF